MMWLLDRPLKVTQGRSGASAPREVKGIPSMTSRSYISSASSTRLCCRAIWAMASSTWAPYTAPVGLLGLITRMALVRPVTLRRMSSTSGAQPAAGSQR